MSKLTKLKQVKVAPRHDATSFRGSIFANCELSAREGVLQPSRIDSTVEPGVEIGRAGRQHALPGGAVHAEPASHQQA